MSYQPRLKLGRLVVQICLKVLTGSLELGLVGLEVFFPLFISFISIPKLLIIVFIPVNEATFNHETYIKAVIEYFGWIIYCT